jgi:acetoin utilization deacetylase AcuC-like enzyme
VSIATDELGASMERLTALLERVETNASAEALEPAREVARAVLEVHEAGLRALLAIVEQQAPDARKALERDPGVLSLLAMHGLCGAPLGERVEAALNEANETLSSQARAALAAIDGEHVRVQIEGREHAARELMQRSVERLLAEHAPDAIVQYAGVGEPWPQAVIPVSRLLGARS